jgi:hypothetical protein
LLIVQFSVGGCWTALDLKMAIAPQSTPEVSESGQQLDFRPNL